MKYSTVALSTSFEHRYKFDAFIFNNLENNNVINNWEMIISRKAHTFHFREDPPDSLPNKTHIYQNYFNKEGKYICVQDN